MPDNHHSRAEDVHDKQVAHGSEDTDECDEDSHGVVPGGRNQRELVPVRVDEQPIRVVDVGRVGLGGCWCRHDQLLTASQLHDGRHCKTDAGLTG